MVSVPLLTERMGVNYFEENLLELYLQVMTRPQQLYEASLFYCFSRVETPLHSCWCRYRCSVCSASASAHAFLCLVSFTQAYRDSVNEVRVGASEGLQRLCKVCGADWLQEKVLPRIHGFYDESTFYLIRIAILNALKKLANGEVSDGVQNTYNRCGWRQTWFVGVFKLYSLLVTESYLKLALSSCDNPLSPRLASGKYCGILLVFSISQVLFLTEQA